MNLLSAFISAGTGLNLLYTMLILPLALALLLLAFPKSKYGPRATVFLLAAALNLIFAIGVFGIEEMTLLIPWAGFGINLALRVYSFSRFMILAAAIIMFLVALFSVSYLKKKDYGSTFFFFFLLSLVLTNGVFLANNMVVLLFFWEGHMVTLFATIIISSRKKPRTAMKAVILNGVADLLLMLGIAATCMAAGTLMMDTITKIPLEGLGLLGFVCMMLGAIGKAGSMPFHSWIPDAATDAPLPFMAFMPAAVEKMMGLYLLTRVVLQFFDFQPGSAMSTLIMAIGAITLVLAVSMALIQKDMKRLLSFHAISQVGYMILGIGTALPIGIVGGLFHLVNNAVYKSALFMAAGNVEKKTGTTDLRQISGLGRYLPLTALGFIIAALSISGVPPFNGFFSKELVFDAAYESGRIFYIAAVAGAFMTAASFLKMGHAAFFGPLRLPEGVNKEEMKEAPGAMVLPLLILAALCVVFGLGNGLPIHQLQAALGPAAAGHFSGWPHSMTMVLISLAVLALALINHIIGYKVTGQAVKAVDHIHYAPVLRNLYNCAEKHYFDPYDIMMVFIRAYAWICYAVDRGINWIYDSLIVNVVRFCTVSLHSFNTGSPTRYMVWSFMGLGFLALLFMILV